MASKIAALATRHRVVLLPGAVLPAEPAYAPLLQTLGQRKATDKQIQEAANAKVAIN